MIALDTNVLVRFLVEDDEAQTERAARLIEGAISQGDRLFITDIVLCETVWVLGRSYKVGRAEIAMVLRRLLHADHLAFSDLDRLSRALDAFSVGAGDFADYVIREQALAVGCTRVATFDKALLEETGFHAP